MWTQIRLLLQELSDLGVHCLLKMLLKHFSRQQKKTALILALNVPIATKVVCFSGLLKCLRSLYGKQCGPRSDCSYRSSLFWATHFASILNLAVMLGNYLQQMTFSDDFFLGALRVKTNKVDVDCFPFRPRKKYMWFRLFNLP